MNFEQLDTLTNIEHMLSVIKDYERCVIDGDKMYFVFQVPTKKYLIDGTLVAYHSVIRIPKFITKMNGCSARKIALDVIGKYLEKVI